MEKPPIAIKKALFSAIFIVIVSVHLQILFVYLFPYTGLGRIIAIPFNIGMSAIISMFYYYAVKTGESAKKYPVLISIPVLILVMFLNAQMFTQVDGIPITQKIKGYINVFQNYENVRYEDIYITNERENYSLNPVLEAKYIAALQKYKDQIPRDGSFGLYNFREDLSVSPTNKKILKGNTKIENLLKTGAEKEFFKLLEATK